MGLLSTPHFSCPSGKSVVAPLGGQRPHHTSLKSSSTWHIDLSNSCDHSGHFLSALSTDQGESPIPASRLQHGLMPAKAST